MTGSLGRVARIVLTVLLVACAVALVASRDFYSTAISSIFFSIALVSTVILHLRVRPFWFDALLVLACSSAFAILDLTILHYPRNIASGLSYLGLSSLLILGIRTVWAGEKDRKLLLCAFVPAILFVGSEWLASTLLAWTEAARPRTLDLYLYAFDCTTRVQLSFLMGTAFLKWGWLKTAGLLFYIGLPIPLAAVYAGQLVRIKEKALPVMIAFLLTGPLGILLYNLFPAVGPIHVFARVFPAYPFSIADARRLLLEPILVPGPRNAIPSLHMAWVLLAWWYARKLTWWTKSIVLAFVVFTALATLGTGEHYFIDLVVAFPFALLIRSIFSFSLSWKNSERLQALLLGGLGTLGWLVLLRFGIPFFWTSPIIPWAFMIATVALTMIRLNRLQDAEDLGQGLANAPAKAFRASAKQARTAGD